MSTAPPARGGGFSRRATDALGDPALQRALRGATEFLHLSRRETFDELAADGAAYRDRARAIREATLGRIADLVEQFADNARKSGATVHFAGDAAEARKIVGEIARASGARSAIKMKSMLTEELEIREGLEAAGIATVETDLGEWILQLAEERPSHLIVPALHKEREAIKALFDHHLGPDDGETPEALVGRAQRALRSAFVTADLGITGCNFAVAESGTLVLVSNEGNGRLVTSGPPVHVALVPFEKVVPTLEETTTLLKMLIQSATGQRLTTYVNWITGPRRDGELDGPRELHVVLVDNGRAEALGTPLEDALRCIRCGACLNACPVYRRVGGHAYDAVYPGPIGIPLTNLVGEGGEGLAHASSLCGACEEVCPVRIDIPHLIIETRRLAVRRKRPPLLERLAFQLYGALVTRPRLWRAALALARLGGRLFGRGGTMAHLPGLGAWTKARELPAPAKISFRKRFARRERANGGR